MKLRGMVAVFALALLTTRCAVVIPMNEGLPPVTAGAKRGIIGGGIGTGALAQWRV